MLLWVYIKIPMEFCPLLLLSDAVGAELMQDGFAMQKNRQNPSMSLMMIIIIRRASGLEEEGEEKL